LIDILDINQTECHKILISKDKEIATDFWIGNFFRRAIVVKQYLTSIVMTNKDANGGAKKYAECLLTLVKLAKKTLTHQMAMNLYLSQGLITNSGTNNDHICELYLKPLKWLALQRQQARSVAKTEKKTPII